MTTVTDPTRGNPDHTEQNVSENGANESAGNNAETETPAPVTIPGFAPEFVELMKGQLKEQVNKHNGLIETIKNTGDRVALKDQIVANPDSLPDVNVAAQVKEMSALEEQLEQLHKAVNEAIEPFIQAALKRSGVENLQAEADTIATQVKATVNYLGSFGVPITDVPSLTGRSVRTSSNATASGTNTPKYKKLRVSVGDSPETRELLTYPVVTTASDGTKTTRQASNLTLGAKAANVTGEAFRKAFTDAAGTTDPGKFPDRVEFVITDLAGKTHYCLVTKDPN